MKHILSTKEKCIVNSLPGKVLLFLFIYSAFGAAVTNSFALPVHNTNTGFNYSTIQAAINDPATVGGHSITIDAGTFTEQLNINKDLNITGSGIGITTIVSPNTLTLSFITTPNNNKAIIYVHDVTNVSLSNMTIDGAGKGNANVRFLGIAYRNAGGNVQYCEIKGMRNNPLDGGQHGIGIYANADNGTARTLNVNHTSIYDFQKNGTTFLGLNLTIVCDNNTVTGAGPLGSGKPAQNGIQLGPDAAGSVTNNQVSNINYTPFTFLSCGILATTASGTSVISGNTVLDCQTSIAVQFCNGSISGNTLQNNGANMGATPYWYMMELEKGTMTVSGNDINGGGNGLGVDGFAWDGEITNISVSNNNITNCETGVATDIFGSTGVSNGQIHNNNITGNTYSLYNDQTTAQDATCNWFGSTNSITVSGSISGNFSYAPYLTDGNDGSASTGFQPTAACLAPCALALSASSTSKASGISANSTEYCLNNCTSPNPPIVLNVIGGSLGSGANWAWYSGSCVGTLVGTGSVLSITPSVATTYFVRAEYAGCATDCISIPVTIK